MTTSLRTLVVGCGDMGSSHARGYAEIDGFEVAGLVSRNPGTREALCEQLGGGIRTFADGEEAIEQLQPDVVSINTFPDTHERFALHALESGAHVFMEKPIATTAEGGQRIVDAAAHGGRKLVVGTRRLVLDERDSAEGLETERYL